MKSVKKTKSVRMQSYHSFYSRSANLKATTAKKISKTKIENCFYWRIAMTMKMIVRMTAMMKPMSAMTTAMKNGKKTALSHMRRHIAVV